MIHIVFGQSIAGSLRFALKDQTQEIIVFPEYFGEGPLYQLFTTEGFQQRIQWLQTTFRFDDAQTKQYTTMFNNAVCNVKALSPNEEITIWTCENAAEQIGLRLVLYLLRHHKIEITIQNTYFNMLNLHKNSDIHFEIRRSGEVAPKQLLQFQQLNWQKSLTKQQHKQMIKEFENLLSNHSVVRTWRDGQIQFDDLTRDDAVIIEHAKTLQLEAPEQQFIQTARLIGTVLGFSEHDIHDTWIEFRLRSLITQGVFEYEGDFRSIRTYGVRLSKI